MRLTYKEFTTDWGIMICVWSERGLWELSFPRPGISQAMADINTDLSQAETAPDDDNAVAQLCLELNMYWRGFSAPFSVPIDWRGYTPFQQAVLKYTADISYGQTMTYGAVAAEIGSSRAARAVGGALHKNRTPVVVPCHRVIGTGGGLTGFGGGLDMKQALLMLEKGIANDLSGRV